MNRAPMKAKPLRRKCAICREPVITTDLRVKWCSVEHGATYAAQLLDKKKQKAKTAERRADAVRKEKIQPLSHFLKKAEKAFNSFIRHRDLSAGQGCISCGRYDAEVWNAGHFKSVGAHPELRFNEDNVHLQCARPCNKDKGGNIHAYRAGLMAKIGPERLAALETWRAPEKMTEARAKEIEALYKQKLKQLMEPSK